MKYSCTSMLGKYSGHHPERGLRPERLQWDGDPSQDRPGLDALPTGCDLGCRQQDLHRHSVRLHLGLGSAKGAGLHLRRVYRLANPQCQGVDHHRRGALSRSQSQRDRVSWCVWCVRLCLVFHSRYRRWVASLGGLFPRPR